MDIEKMGKRALRKVRQGTLASDVLALIAEVKRLRAMVAGSDEELEEARRAWLKMNAESDNKILVLEREVRELRAEIGKLETVSQALKRQGL